MNTISHIDNEVLETWDAPTCLQWLAQHASGANHFASRALDWHGEVRRFANHEGISEEQWNDQVTDELREGIRDAIRASRPFPQLAYDAPTVPDGYEPRRGVEFGCGDAACDDCYRWSKRIPCAQTKASGS